MIPQVSKSTLERYIKSLPLAQEEKDKLLKQARYLSGQEAGKLYDNLTSRYGVRDYSNKKVSVFNIH